MKRQTTNADQNLAHMDSRGVLLYSRGLSGKTNDQVAHDMDLGEETVARYQRHPAPGEHTYDLPIGRVRSWCRSVGNYTVVQWIAQQCGGVFVRVDKDCPHDMDLSAQISKVNKEASDVVTACLDAMRDGTIDPEERERISRELRELLTRVESACMVAEKK